jgi:hypothetical protein
MRRSPTDQPKYLMCARALALLSGLTAGAAAGCGSSLVPAGRPTPPAYEGGVMGVRVNPDARPTPYDGGITGIGPVPPYDGGAVGVRINPDANVRPDAQTFPYDGGFLGVRINPDAL